jgi:hypothetical protein
MPTRCNRCFLLQILLLAQHVSGTTMAIIRSLRVLYCWLLPVVFGAWFSSCWYRVELRVTCPVCGWASNNICNKKSVASSWHFISSYDSNLITNRKYYESYAQNKYKGRKTVHWLTHTHKEGLWISSNYLCTCCIVNCTSIDLNNTGQAQL